MHFFQYESPKKKKLQTTAFYNRIVYLISSKSLQRQNKLKGP